MPNVEKIGNQYDEPINPRQPLPVDTVEAQAVESKSNTITYNGKAAVGAITVNSTTQKPLISITGDQVGSFWGEADNLVYSAKVDREAKSGEARFTSVTETDGSAAFVVIDTNKDLELMFESLTTTVKRYVARVTDTGGSTLYGWIFGVATSGSQYTFSVVNNRLTETQNWVGSQANFASTALMKVEIFKYNSSLVFGTGTTLTEEVMCPREYSRTWFEVLKYASETLSTGQYFVDYMRGRIVGKKADTTANETITYNVWASTAAGGTSSADVYAGDTVAAVTDEGGLGSTRRQDTPIEDSAADGVYQHLKSDNIGALYVAEVNRPGYEDNVNNIAMVEASPTTSTSNAWSYYQGQALDDGQVIVNAACKVKSVIALIDTAAASDEYFLHVLDATAVPIDGAVTLVAPPKSVQHVVGTQSAIVIDFSDPGRSFTTGLTAYVSTTQIIKTIAGSVAIFGAEYVS